MCEIKTLYFKENLGFVVQCKDCKLITVGFGMLSVSRTVQEFHQLLADAQSCYECHSGLGQNPKYRDIPFWQVTENVCVVFSLNDLLDLMELLELAKPKLILHNLLDSFSLN